MDPNLLHVGIVGEDALGAVQAFSGFGYVIEPEAGTLWVRHPSWAKDAQGADAAVARTLNSINGLRRTFRLPKLKAVVGPLMVLQDGLRHVYTVGTDVISHSESLVIHNGDYVRHEPEDTANELITALAINEPLQEACRILEAQNASPWPDVLSKVIEALQRTGVRLAELPEGRNVDRLTKTANNDATIGEQARHASRRYTPIDNPMSEQEARELVHRLIPAVAREVLRRKTS